MKIRAFITHKKSENYADCQDRLSVNCDTRRMAVSDGVSQSIFPDLWANLLANHYTQAGQVTEEDRIELCKEWNNLVLKYIADEKTRGNNPWRTESNLAEGLSAGATLCGVQFSDESHWICDVIGDSCLIKVGKDNTMEIVSSEEKAFDTYPDFLDSNPRHKGRGEFRTVEGTLTADDKLLLVSDPFSDFFYKLQEGSAPYLERMLSLNSHEAFVALVDDWRHEGMHNDDSTVIIVEYDGQAEFDIIKADDINMLMAIENGSMPLMTGGGTDKEENKGSSDQEDEKGVPADKEMLTQNEEEKKPAQNDEEKKPTQNEEEKKPAQNDEEKKPTQNDEEKKHAQEDANQTSTTATPEREGANTQQEESTLLIDLDAWKLRCKKHIPEFIEQFQVDEYRKYGYTTFVSLIRFILCNREARVEELCNLLKIVLNRYVDSIK